MQVLRDAVTCAVCSEVYQSGIREPLALPCGHSFCRMCLDAVKRTGNFLCPNCRQTHNNVNVEQLSVNYALLSVSSACPDVKYDACGFHGDDQKYWCCNCEKPLCSLCLNLGHHQGHNVKLCNVYVLEEKMTLEAKLHSCDEKMEKQKEEMKNKFVELLQGVQRLSQTSSDILNTQHYMNSILYQIKKANDIGCIKSLDKCVEQFLADFTKNKKVGKKEGTSEAAGYQRQRRNKFNGQLKIADNLQKQKVKNCQLAFQDGRVVLHCFGNPTVIHDDRLSIQMPSEVFLELSVGGRCLGRVYIHLWTEMRRAHQFLTLCMGTLGPSYRGAKSREVRNQGKPGEVMVFPYHVESDREINEAIFSNIERGDRLETMVEGLIGANIQPLQPSLHQHLVPFNYPQQYNCIYQAQTYGDYASSSDDETSGFMICTIGSPKVKWSRPFGKVLSGLDVVKDAVRYPSTQITISNCGMVLPAPPNLLQTCYLIPPPPNPTDSCPPIPAPPAPTPILSPHARARTTQTPQAHRTSNPVDTVQPSSK